MSRTLIAPVIAVICLAIKGIFQIEIGEDLQAQIADSAVSVIFTVIALVGVFKNHKKKKEED